MNSPSATDRKDGSACESPYSQSVFTMSLCSLWSTRHVTEIRFFGLKCNKVNEVSLHLSCVPVKISLPTKTQRTLKRDLLKSPHDKQPHCRGLARKFQTQFFCL